MNENPGEMPNPLNPNPTEPKEPVSNLDANPAEPVQTVEVKQPVAAEPVDPMENAVAGVANQPPVDPMSRPMEQAPVAELVQPKKKKTGLIIGIVVASLLVIGGAVAAILLLNMNQGDPVARAVAKLMSGETSNIALNGSIEMVPTNESTGISSIKIDLNSQLAANSLTNSTEATLTVVPTNADEISLKVNESYTDGADLFLKIDGISEIINGGLTQDTTSDDLLEEEIVDDEYVEYDDDELIVEDSTYDLIDSFAPMLSIVENLEGKWLRVSSDELKSMLSSTEQDDSLKCLADIAAEAKNSNNSLAELYSKNPFIGSTREGVTLASHNNPVYKVVINQEKYAAYADSLQNSTLIENLGKCMAESGVTTGEDTVDEIQNLPDIYVEVDGNDNITRFYSAFETNSEDDVTDCNCPDDADCDCATTASESMNVTIDFDVSYPASVNVAEPTEYDDLMTVLQQLFMTMYTGDGVDTSLLVTE